MTDELLAVALAADRARDLRQQAAEAQRVYVQAVRSALADHTGPQVAQAAGVSKQALYRALAALDGPRRKPKPKPEPQRMVVEDLTVDPFSIN